MGYATFMVVEGAVTLTIATELRAAKFMAKIKGRLSPATAAKLDDVLRALLNGKKNHEVFDPSTGNLITDIDHILDGVLWEEKSAGHATDIAKWIKKQIREKFERYMRARKELPGYEDAPIGFRFPKKPFDANFAKAIEDEIEALRREFPDVDIRLDW